MWKPRKQKRKGVLRKCFVSSETMKLVEEFRGNQPPDARLFPVSDNTMNARLCREFKKLNLNVSSHDFRHAKLTNLGQFLTP